MTIWICNVSNNFLNNFLFFRKCPETEEENNKLKDLAIKPRPLTIKKQPPAEIPRLRSYYSKEEEEKR